MANTIDFKLRTIADLKGVNELKRQLQDINRELQGTFPIEVDYDVESALQSTRALQQALEQAYDPKFNTLSFEKFNKSLNSNHTNLQKVILDLGSMGSQGQAAIGRLAASFGQMGITIKKTNKVLNEMAQTMKNTVTWGISSGIWNQMLNSTQQAYGYIKNLDTALNDIRIVTGQSADQMRDFSKDANEAAKALAVSTKDYTEGALIYYQQGLDDDTVKALTDITAKTANVTGQSMAEVSEQLTAVWNGYNVANEAAEKGFGIYEEYVDKLAAVGAATASDLEELATAMSKVASSASMMGVNIDQLSAQVATIVSVTRQAPESVGTALKTIYARMGDLQVDGVDEFGTTLGEVSSTLESVGIRVLDEAGNLREMGTVMEEVAEKWQGWTEAQRQAIAVAMAGKRQYNNLTALFNNWNMYQDTLAVSKNAAGTLQEQQDTAMESLNKKLEVLRASSEEIYQDLFDADSIGNLVEIFTKLVQAIDKVVKSFNGLKGILPLIGSLGFKVFNTQIAQGLTNMRNRIVESKQSISDMENQLKALEQISNNAKSIKDNGGNASSSAIVENATEEIKNNYAEIYQYQKMMSSEEIELFNSIQKERGALVDVELQRQESLNTVDKIKNKYDGIFNTILDSTGKNAEGSLGLIRAEDLSNIANYQKELELLKEGLEIDIKDKFVIDDSFIDRQSRNLAQKFKNSFSNSIDDGEIKNIIQRAINTGDFEELSYVIVEPIDNLKKKIEELRNSDGSSFDDIFSNIAKNGQEGSIALELIKKKLADTANTGKTVDQIFEEVIQDLREMKTNGDQVNGTTNQINGSVSRLGQAMDKLKKDNAFKQLASDATKLAQGLSGGASGIMMLASIPKTLDNDNLSTMEKTLQIVISLSSALPMLVTGLKNVISGFSALPALLSKIGSALGALLASPTGAIIAAITVAVVALGAAIYATIKKTQSAEEELKALKDAANDATEKANELKNAFTELTDSLTEWQDKVDSLKDLSKSTEEYTKTVQEANEQLLNLVSTNEELAQYVTRNSEGLLVLKEGYEDVLNKMSESASITNATAQNLKMQVNQATLDKQKEDLIGNVQLSYLNNAYNTEDQLAVPDYEAAVNTLISSYEKNGDLIGKDIDELSRGNQSLKEALTENKQEIIDLAKSINENTEVNKLLLDEDVRSLLEQDKTYADANEQEKTMMAQSAKNINVFSSDYSGFKKEATFGYYKGGVGGYRDEETHDAYKEALAAQWGIDASQIDVKDKVGKAIYTNTLTGETETKTDKEAAALAVAFHQELQKQEALESDKDFAVSKQAILDFSAEAQKQLGGKESSAYSAFMEIASKSMETQGRGFDASDIDLSMIDYSGFQKINELLDSGELTSYLDKMGLSIDDFNNALAGLTIEALKQQTKLSFKATSDKTTSLKDNIVSGDVTSKNIKENEDYQAIAAQMDNIIALYPEMTKQAEIFNNENLVGTQEYLDALTQLQDKMDEGVLEALRQEAKKAGDDFEKLVADKDFEVRMGANPEEFESAMDKILDADYSVNVEIHAQAEEAFEDLEQGIEDIQNATGMIGEGFVVAADDIRELNNAFPGILQNCEYLQDGTIKLSQESVNAAQEAVATEVATDTEGTIAKLKNQATELRGKQATYQGMADAARKLATMEMASDEQKAQYKKVIENGIAEISAQSDTSQTDGAKAVADNSIDNSRAVAMNWGSAYSDAANAAVQFAQTAIDAQVAATTPGGKAVTNKVKVNYSGGQSGVSTSIQANKLNADFASASTAQQYNALAEQYQEAADSLGAQANDIEGMIVAAGALGATGINSAKDTGKSKSSGSGGGGSSKDQKEFTDDTVDRYWSVNKALDAINDELDKLEDKQSTMSGKQLIESLQEENKLLDQQIEKQKEKQKLQIQEAEQIQGRLKSFGVTFKDTGEITNYEAAYQAQINAYNAAVSAYNSGALDEAGMSIAEQKYEDFKAQIERYDTLLYDEMKDVADAISEEEKKQRENTLAIFEEDYKIKLDFSEAERDMQDFLAEMEEDFTKVYEDLGKKSKNIVASFSTYQGDNGTIAADLAAIGVVEREIMNLHTTGYSGMFETISQAQERLKELQSDLMDHAKDMKDLFQDTWDAYMDGIDQAADKFENLMDEFDRINNNLEYQAELIELIYGEEAYDMMDKLYSAQINNSGVQIESLRHQKAFWAEQAEAAKQSYGEESEAYQEAYEKMRDCEQDLNDAVLDRINLIKDQYQNAVSSTIDALEKQMTSGSALDYMQDQWDRLKESADLYMDATEKAYNTETFKANVDQAIADTKSIKAKQKLLEFQEKELKALREKKQLTQYDIDAANARFDILQKEIALEDAQNSKNTMKVTRNQEGNWTYQYVADEDDVASKRQALLDSYKELYELSKTAYQSNIENLLKLDQEYLSKKKEYLEKYGADSQEMADLDKWYQEISMGYANEAATAKSGLQEAQLGLTLEIYKQDEEAYASMTSEQQRLVKEATDNNISDFNSVYDAVRDNMNGIVDSIESSLVEGRSIWDIAADQMIDKWAGDDGSSVKAMVTDANDKLIEATQKYEEQVSDTADKAGQDFGPDGISGAIKGAEDETDNLKNKTAELASDSSSQLENLRNSVDQVKTAWEGVVQSIQDAINNIQQYLSLMQAAATASQTTFSGTTNYGNYNATNSDSGGNNGGGSSSGTGPIGNRYKLISVSVAPNGTPRMGIPQLGVSMEIPSNLRRKNIAGKDRDLFIEAFIKKYPKYQGQVYKTGGYTGNWPMSQGDGLDSDNGRLGILHQKELVLNASDTENILDAVKIVRSMPNIISSIQNAISNVVGEKLSNMTNEISQGKVVSTTAGSNKEENNVYNIVAEFPNANSAAEIEQALLNLKNIAAQKNGIRK